MHPARKVASRWLSIWGLWAAVAAAPCLVCQGAAAAEFLAGRYAFSDELGGFRILSVTGSGSSIDPIVITEELDEAAPITLVVRRRSSGRLARGERNVALTIIKVVINRSRRIWAGFEIELQEQLRQPSVFTDGLSFNQLGPKQPDVSADSFADNNRVFEPHDRIRFEKGFVDPEATARFKFTITDPTPDWEFFIVQDPKLLMSGWPTRNLARLE